MFKRLLKADRYYYKNNTKAVNELVAKYGMNKVPLEQIDIIGCQESLNINVFLYENNGWKNYTTKSHSNGLFIGIFNNCHAVIL